MKRSAFTLVELLVVISIIGLLSTVAVVSMSSARVKAREARRLADLRQIGNALELFAQDNGAYPGLATTYYWIADNNLPGTSGYPPCGTSGGLIAYIPNVCTLKDPQGYNYAYAVDSAGAFKLGARFEYTSNQGAPFTYNGGATTVANYYEPK